jgi:glycosyltransferase involved in cell wall biosynthesis
VSKPLFTVVIPHHNRPEKLGRALESVYAQTFQNFEVFVVDDGSDISLWNQCQSLFDERDNRLKVIRNECGINAAHARNCGVKQASGEFVVFLDDDDVFLTTKLEEIYTQITNGKFSADKQQILYSQLKHGNDSEYTIKPLKGKLPTQRVSEYLFCNQGKMQTSTLVVPTVLAKKLMFDESLPKHQDYDLVLRAEKLGVEFVFIDKPLVCWLTCINSTHLGQRYMALYSYSWWKSRRSMFSKAASANFLFSAVFSPALYNRKYYEAIKLHFAALFERGVTIKVLVKFWGLYLMLLLGRGRKRD